MYQNDTNYRDWRLFFLVWVLEAKEIIASFLDDSKKFLHFILRFLVKNA